MPAMPQPEAYIGGADKLLDPEGKLTNAGTGEFLARFMNAFASWIERQTRV
jgi:chromate reductase